MPVSAATLRKLMDAGLSGDDLIDVVASIDADHGAMPKVRSAHAIRQERYMERKASQNVTNDASYDVSAETLPSPKEVSPAPLQEITPSLPTTHKENPPKGGQKKASRLPSDWVLPTEWRQDARDAGLSESLIDLEADKIRDWSRSAKAGSKLDWRAAWRNWCRSAVPNQRGSPPQRMTVSDAARSLREELEQANERSNQSFENRREVVVAFPTSERGRLG